MTIQRNKVTRGDHFHLFPEHSIFRITHHPMKTQINLLIFCIQFYYHWAQISECDAFHDA